MYLQEQQIERETQGLQVGSERYFKKQERIEKNSGYGSSDAGSNLITACLPAVSQGITAWIKEGPSIKARDVISEVDPDLIALISLNAALNGARRAKTVANTASQIGRMIESEVWAIALDNKDPKLLQKLVHRSLRTHGNVKYRKKALWSIALKEGFKPEKWEETFKATLGVYLLNIILLECPNVFETYLETTEKNRTYKRVGMTPEAVEFLVKHTTKAQWVEPFFSPMLVKPKDWIAFDTGAYTSDQVSKLVPLIRTHDQNHVSEVRKAISSGKMDRCLKALNIIQGTQWQINKPVADLVRWAWETSQDIPGFPLNRHVPKPTIPDNWEDLSEIERKGWRIRASQVAGRNRGIDGDRVTMLQDLSTAQGLYNQESFWIPHSLDFRGRVYPVPAYNGQRADHIRGTLQFSKGLPLGDQGPYWLAVHLANCGDFDKISKGTLDERDQWTIDNEDMVRRIASDPQGTVELWRNADKPFQFIAACLDYNNWLNDAGYASRISVALDGSNSGLQHYSASLRSLEGSLVNLIPSDLPADLYQAVASRVEQSVIADSEAGSEIAKIILKNGISRKLVKRNAMTFTYSSGEYGMKIQHMDDLMRPLNDKVLFGELKEHPYGYDGGFQAAGYLAKKVFHEITKLVPDATKGMKFFQQCAAALAHEKKGITWTTPIGLPVSHKYTEWDSKTVAMFLYDKHVPVSKALSADKVLDNKVLKWVNLQIRTTPERRINKEKAKSAIAPNVIHSMDASHLMMTVLAANEKGIEDFSLIHDSFGTHAANTTELFYTVREAFIDLYDNYCPYETIRTSTLKSITDKSKVPDLPTKGDLDINGVLNSLYAFS